MRVSAAQSGPQITAHIFPAANSNGWHNSGAAISFSCVNAPVSCTGLSTLTTEGSDQVVPGTASDGVAEAYAYPEVDIDLTSPSVTVTSPATGGSTSASTVSIEATVSDSLSGLWYAECNGETATIVGGTVECAVPLKPGVNAVVVTVMDNAGNSKSSGIKVTRTGTASALHGSPSHILLLEDQTKPLTVSNDFGAIVTDATWTSSNELVASVSTGDGMTSVEGVAEGTAILTAAKGQLTATIEVTVVDTLPSAGDLLWEIAPPSSAYTYDILYPSKFEDGPDMIAVEYDDTAETFYLRGLVGEGTQASLEASPGLPLFTDVYGGVVVTTGSGLARLGGSASLAPWRYDFQGYMYSAAAQGSDGTIYLVEADENGQRYILGIDGATGAAKFRQPVAQSSWHTYNLDCFTGWHTGGPNQSEVSNPIIGGDDKAYFEVSVYHGTFNYLPCNTGVRTLSAELKVITLSSTGAMTTSTLWSGENDGTASIGELLAGDENTVLATWTRNIAPFTNERKVSLVTSSGVSTHTLDDDVSVEMVDREGRVYLWDGATVTAVALDGWTTEWTASSTGRPIEAAVGGGILTYDAESQEVIRFDASGDDVETQATGLSGVATDVHEFQWIGYDEEGVLRAVSGIGTGGNRVYFQRGRGNSQRLAAPREDYVSAQNAAHWLMRRFRPSANDDGFEYGGAICQRGSGKFFGGVVTTDGLDNTVSIVRCPANVTYTGTWHIHPPHLDPVPSGGDSDVARYGTNVRPTNDEKYIPPGLRHFVVGHCGIIYQYEWVSTSPAHLAQAGLVWRLPPVFVTPCSL